MNTIDEDIEFAKLWHNNASQYTDGKGDGWRHTCYRLAAEIERLREENKALRAAEAAEETVDGGGEIGPSTNCQQMSTPVNNHFFTK